MNLHDALDQLPDFDPRPDLWNRIAGELDAEATIDRAMLQLPEFEPAAEAWEALESRLANVQMPPFGEMTASDGQSTEKIRPLWNRVPKRASILAAATVAGLLGGWLYLTLEPPETVTVTYSIEVAKPVQPKSAAPPIDARQLIAERCQEVKTVCEKPEVKELRTELADLDNRQAQLKEQLAVFGNDPQLVEAQARLQSQREEVTKELVELLAI
ncbi:hypothetical protein [Tellurirhabdus rosea]|uniref:hypothetical protein n=1 Tax=Tellurirhabdus rosea TaxID=2674997 RepID=UPI0022569EAD|nr:hypothetical protein [Tellurirhabdus rosea]